MRLHLTYRFEIQTKGHPKLRSTTNLIGLRPDTIGGILGPFIGLIAAALTFMAFSISV